MEKITYLVANYNNGRYLPDCINSLKEQTDPDWLCIICDDASTDDSVKIIKELADERIRLIQNERNLGLTATRIKLIRNASTDILGILDADDALFPEATETILGVYARNPEAGLVYTRHGDFNEDLSHMIRIGSSRPVPEGRTSLTFGGYIHSLVTFRMSVYNQTEGYDASLRSAEDRDLAYKLEEVTNPVFIDRVLYKYRVVNSSLSHSTDTWKIGYTNHFRARKNALRRRRMSFFKRMYYLVQFQLRYIVTTNTIYRRVKRKLAGLSPEEFPV